ncbi:MAG: hypothetical protein ACYCV7_13560 [Acidimicrobiales bacterium]
MLTVNPKPIPSPAGEVQPSAAVVVAITQVTAPISSVPDSFGVGLSILVVPLERRCGIAPDDLTDRMVAVDGTTGGIETRRRALESGYRVDDGDIGSRRRAPDGVGRRSAASGY